MPHRREIPKFLAVSPWLTDRSVAQPGARRMWIALILLAPLLCPPGQAQDSTLVIAGGTLIDGNGGTPIRNATIVIEGNRIVEITTEPDPALPDNATIVDADGKFILPGLWDAQVSYNWYYGEVMLNYGITSTIDVGTSGGEVAVLQRDAVINGHVRGPRAFTGISRIIRRQPSALMALETTLTQNRGPQSAEDTRRLVNAFIDATADYIIFQDGRLPLEYYRAGFEVADRRGVPVFTRSYGPVFGPRDAAALGSTNLPHSAGVARAITRDPTERADADELEMYADIDPERAESLISLLIENDTALTPTFKIEYPGYPREWRRFEEDDRRFFAEADADLLAYYPSDRIADALGRYTDTSMWRFRGIGVGAAGPMGPNGIANWEELPAEQRAVYENRMRGFQAALEFHKQFVDSGGRLVPGANTNPRMVPGNNLHHEIAIFVEAGVTPMQIIQGATKWAAEMVRKDNDLGTVEVGKIADVVILDEDPLDDVENLRAVDTVIFGGKVAEPGYHSWHGGPFWMELSNRPVEALRWVVEFKESIFGEAGPRSTALRDPLEAPQPAIETITPIMITAGADDLTLSLTGFHFVRGSRVFFKGRPVPNEVLSAVEMEVTLDAGLLREVGRFELLVQNPPPLSRAAVAPWGDGTSNSAFLIVNYADSEVR